MQVSSKMQRATQGIEQDIPHATSVLAPAIQPPRTWGQISPQGQSDVREQAWDATTDAIRTAYQSGGSHLIDALPSTGKTYSTVKLAAELDEPTTLLLPRGNKEMYGQIEEWGDEFGINVAIAPSFPKHCDTAKGEFGQDWKTTVIDEYQRGASPKQIHAHHDDMPCQNTQGMRCEYKVKWESLDPSEVDVIVGHYNHAHVESLTKGRHVVLDEWPEAFATELSHEQLRCSVDAYLNAQDELDIEDWGELVTLGAELSLDFDEEAWAQDRKEELLGIEAWDDDRGMVFEDSQYYAGAPEMVYTQLAGEEVGNGWVRAELPDGSVGIFHWERREFVHLDAPDWSDTQSLICLDGTPAIELWEPAVQRNLTYTQVLSNKERKRYIKEGLNHSYVTTTTALKPYNNTDHINLQSDAALLEHVAQEHGDAEAGLISTRSAMQHYERHDILEFEKNGTVTEGSVDQVTWYGNILGSNNFKQTRVGVVIGSNHYGNQFIEKWGALANEAVEYNNQRGKEASFGEWGNAVLEKMRESETLQATLRFGRDGHGALVYIHTDTLPEWVPVEHRGDIVRTWSEGEQQVLEALQDGVTGGTKEIAHHPAVRKTERHVRRILKALAERGIVNRAYEGQGWQWSEGDFEQVNEHGEVVESYAELAAVPGKKTADISRMTTYTLNVRTLEPVSVTTVPTDDKLWLADEFEEDSPPDGVKI